jgi:hypothetical protein
MLCLGLVTQRRGDEPERYAPGGCGAYETAQSKHPRGNAPETGSLMPQGVLRIGIPVCAMGSSGAVDVFSSGSASRTQHIIVKSQQR